MSNGLRIGLRLLGLVLLLAGVGAIVLLFEPGPRQIADWMGDNCAHTKNGPSEQCNVLDVIEILLAAPWLILIGGVMTLALRRSDRGPVTIDLSRFRRRRQAQLPGMGGDD